MKLRALLILLLANAAASARPPNVLFIAIDDLRSDLGALGVAHAKTPQLDAFAKSARIFSHHYVQVPTCGASRCALMRGCYPSQPAQIDNNGIVATQSKWADRSLPAIFRQSGYRTLSLGKITHYPGGLTGKDWAAGKAELPGAWDRSWVPESPWKTPQGIMHGYANGGTRQPGKSPAWEAPDVPDDAYPDAWVARDAVSTLKELASQKQPWFFGVGFFKPHLPFAAPKRWHDLHAADAHELEPMAAAKPTWPSGWHDSGEFRKTYTHPNGRNPDTDAAYALATRRAYAAAVSYMDAQLGRVLDALKSEGLEENTIVVIWSDHGFLLGEHSIWGKHCLYEQSLRSPLMIRRPGLPKPGETAAATVETVDLLPTLADLSGVPVPAGLDGRSLRPHLDDPATPSAKPALSFWNGGRRSVRNDRWRLTIHPKNKQGAPDIELFDYRNDPAETRNHAPANPETIAAMMPLLGKPPSEPREN